jgi:hypothetical protein
MPEYLLLFAELLYSTNPDSIIDGLIHKITEAIKANTITTTIPIKYRTMKPWISPGILRCIKNRNKLQKEVRMNPYDQVKKIIYIRYRNYCNNLIKKLKRKYERDLLANSVKNKQLLWKNIKNITYTNIIKSHNM